MHKTVPDSRKVSPYLLWFIIHGTQTGVGMLTFQRNIAEGAEQDAWLSLLLVGVLIHVIVGMLFYLLRHAEGGDLLSLHRQLFGKVPGGILSLVMYVYSILAIVGQIRPYAEVIHAWVFPDAYLWQIALVILAISAYIVTGGFRVVAGICFITVLIPSLLIGSLYFPLKFAHWSNMLPMLNHSAMEYWASARSSVFMYLGAEFILLYYPFIKNGEKAQKWAHLAVAHTNVLYLIILVISFLYFNMTQLKNTVWPTLILSKIIYLPFLERIDYIYVFNWFIVILPVCCIALWGAVRILRCMFGLSVYAALILSILTAAAAIVMLRTPIAVERLMDALSQVGAAFLFGYIPFLFLWLAVKRLWQGRAASGSDS